MDHFHGWGLLFQRVFLTADETGRITVTSLDVAEKFGKAHGDVLKAIQALEIPDDFMSGNFSLFMVERPMPRGGVRTYPAYSMTRDGFALLVMGFTGKKAMEWKVRYIQAFNAMEAELRRREEARLKAQAEQAKAALEREKKLHAIPNELPPSTTRLRLASTSRTARSSPTAATWPSFSGSSTGTSCGTSTN